MAKRAFRGMVVVGTTVAAAAGGLVLASAPAGAAQSTQQVTCAGTTYTVRTNNNSSSENGGWGVAQLVGEKGHGIPTSFSGSAVDDTTNTELFSFSSAKGGGNANQNQPQTTCIQTLTGTADEVFGGAPPGVNPNDLVTFTLTISVVIKQ
jgi:hypothetical protein